MNIAETLTSAAARLAAAGIAQPRREAASLLGFALGKSRAFLIAHDDYVLSAAEAARCEQLLARRADREPFQHLTGVQEFYGLDFVVSPDVLIPRPETEIIVENALEIVRDMKSARVCEIGVGSGCISTAILHEAQNVSAIGLDISAKALEIARFNAEKHSVADRLELKISDVFACLDGEKFDLIVSNPPYIPAADIAGLEREVKDFEPLGALTDGADGLSIIKKIADGAPGFLRPGGFLLMEIGFGQSEQVAALFAPAAWETADFLLDLQGIERTVRARRRA